MNKLVFYSVFFLSMIVNSIFGQTPGGVGDVVLWKDGFNRLNRNTVYNPSSFNYNDYMQFPEDDTILKIGYNNLRNYTLFYVFDYNGSNSFATIYTGEKKCIFTDSSLISSKVNLFTDEFNKARFLTFISSAKNGIYEKVKTPYLKFGNDNYIKNNEKAKLAEVIMYGKILSKKQIQKVESYLSIKYGISLPIGKDYIGSGNVIIWDASKNTKYPYRVTAIGKDRAGNLDVRQSTNNDSEIKLEIGLDKIYFKNKNNPSSLSDKNYLFWSDNGKKLVFNSNNDKDKYKILERRWKFNTVGNDIENRTISFRFNPKEILNYDSTQEYSLVFYDKSIRNISGENVDIFQLDKKNGYLSANIKIDFNKFSNPFFTILQSENFHESGNFLIEFKNPVSKATPFNVFIRSEEPIEGDFYIYDNNMHLLSRKILDRGSESKVLVQIDVAGIYFIVVKTKKYQKIKKLIVQ